jgi:hypothetical protein
MRGNHIIWGRAEAPVPDATTASERAAIAACKLTLREGFKHWFDVSLNGKHLGRVRTTFGAMEYWPAGEPASLYAGGQWSDSDPRHCLAILALLSWHNV